jgi:glycosyltransferase involved in cell wall biosynthesis
VERPIRVLHVLHSLAGGGAERLVLDLCRHASEDVDVTVATIMSGGALQSEYEAAGVVVRCADRKRHRPGVRALARLRQWCGSVDVVHTHLWSGDFFGGLGALSSGRPAVSTVHNTRGDGAARDALLRALPRRNLYVGVSPAASDFAIDAGAPVGSVRCIPNGIDLGRFPSSPWTAGPPWRLLFVGRLTRQKGVDRLIRAMVGLESVSLEIVGEGEEEVALRTLARELGVPVTFSGWVPDVAHRYADAHLLVLPSRWEGFGLVAVEAMAAGRPVLGCAVDGLADVLGEVGICIEGEGVEGLRQSIKAALLAPSELAMRAAAGPSHASQWGMAGVVRAYEALYRELARPGSRS